MLRAGLAAGTLSSAAKLHFYRHYGVTVFTDVTTIFTDNIKPTGRDEAQRQVNPKSCTVKTGAWQYISCGKI